MDYSSERAGRPIVYEFPYSGNKTPLLPFSNYNSNALNSVSRAYFVDLEMEMNLFY
jgi:hypothetical protein